MTATVEGKMVCLVWELHPVAFCNIEPMRARWIFLFLSIFLTRAAWPQTSPKKKSISTAATQSCGPITNDTLKCLRFQFTYKIPYGWVDRTDEMQEDPDSSKPENAKPDSPKSETLLAIFERPPAASGETINSAVVIAAEPLSGYHRIKTAADYFGPITELAEQRGFKTINEPHEVVVGIKHLIRADFNKDRGKLTMWQSSLVMIEKGSILSFTFVAGSENEIDELIEHLHFSVTAAPHH
jgi:hypothetical protein